MKTITRICILAVALLLAGCSPDAEKTAELAKQLADECSGKVTTGFSAGTFGSTFYRECTEDKSGQAHE